MWLLYCSLGPCSVVVYLIFVVAPFESQGCQCCLPIVLSLRDKVTFFGNIAVRALLLQLLQFRSQAAANKGRSVFCIPSAWRHERMDSEMMVDFTESSSSLSSSSPSLPTSSSSLSSAAAAAALRQQLGYHCYGSVDWSQGAGTRSRHLVAAKIWLGLSFLVEGNACHALPKLSIVF